MHLKNLIFVLLQTSPSRYPCQYGSDVQSWTWKLSYGQLFELVSQVKVQSSSSGAIQAMIHVLE